MNKIIYWIATGIMCAIFLFSAYNYFTQYDLIASFFEKLNFPTWLVYPLAIAKVLGVIAVVSRKSALLKEWAYAGFFFDAALALAAHIIAQDGTELFSVVAIIALLISRFMEGKVFAKRTGFA